MDDKKLFEFQKKQIQVLREEKAAAMEALDLASSLATFSVHSHDKPERKDLLREICSRANRMISFKMAAIYLVDESTQDFFPAFSAPPNNAKTLDREVQSLIGDQSFAFALQAEGPVFFLNEDKTAHLLLHVLSTQSRVRGMFVGLLSQGKEFILDTTLKLFSVVMLSAAHALENLEFQEFMRNHTAELDRKVKERTRELTEASKRLRKTVEGMQAGVVLIEGESQRIVDANPMALKMIGRTRDEVLGGQCNTYFCPALKNKCPVLDLGQEVDSAERVMISKGGQEIPILKTVSKVLVGGKLHLVESFIDITQQKKFTKLKEDVERIMRHDLKTPLNGIINLPDIIISEGDNLTDSQREDLELIQSSGYKLLKMINMSLDIYKMETNNYKYSPAPQDLMIIIRSVLRDQAENFRAKAIEVVIQLNGARTTTETTLMISCEELLVYSLLSNLLKNAIEASEFRDSIALEIELWQGMVILSITNSGLIPEDIRETIFDKYVTSGKVGGTGLGTYSAKLIAETMGGSIECASSENEGTTMVVSIPHQPV